MNVVRSIRSTLVGVAYVLIAGPAAPQTPGGVVANAPYSADVVSTVTQVLADGTRIEQSISGRVYRDSVGRMRREQQVLGLNGIVTSGTPTVITITDPTTRATYTIDDAARTARRTRFTAVLQLETTPWSAGVTWLGLAGVTGAPVLNPDKLNAFPTGVLLPVLEANLTAAAIVRDRTTLQQAAAGLQRGGGRGARGGGPAANGGGPESLGSRQMEGVLVNGTRLTQTIATGQIGNDRPIVITDEAWTSPDLQVLVYSKHHDPRTGDVEYRLRNISRNEPPASLFQIPAGYTVIDPPQLAVPAGRTGGGGRGTAPTPPPPRAPGQ
jgi:hypothetical protein